MDIQSRMKGLKDERYKTQKINTSQIHNSNRISTDGISSMSIQPKAFIFEYN